jgi:endoglucanase
VDTVHTIVVGASEWNHPSQLSSMPEYKDDNLLYTFHFYSPFIFTHQGADQSPLADFHGIPFPYESSRMTDCPDSLIGTWVESAIKSYPADGSIDKVKSIIDMAATFKETRSTGLFCGEFGVLRGKSEPTDRLLWYQTVAGYLIEKGIPWTIWDYKGSFGLFNANTNQLFENDLDTSLLSVLQLTIPEQKKFEKAPIHGNFEIYSDYIAENIYKANELKGGKADYYSESSPASGNYCIKWEGSNQYGSLVFDFKPDCDLSDLRENNFTLKFYIRCSNPLTKIQIRFVDTKNGESDHPWRMSFDLGNLNSTSDGEWQWLKIPLSAFQETGAWDNQWFNPIGEFDWANIDKLEIVAEYHSLSNSTLEIDELTISEITSSAINFRSDDSDVLEIFPNPASNSVIIKIKDNNKNFSLSIADLNGKIVKELITESDNQPKNSFAWDRTDSLGKRLPPGIYFCRLKNLQGIISKKIIVQ